MRCYLHLRWHYLCILSIDIRHPQALTRCQQVKSRREREIWSIDKSLALERKIESRKRNFSLDLENLIVSISLSTLDFREWQEKFSFYSRFSRVARTKFSFYSRFSRVARQNSLSLSIFLYIFESSNREFNIISPSH